MYAAQRVIKIKKDNLKEVLSKVFRGIILMSMVYLFFIFKLVFKNSKVQEEILAKGKELDVQSVDNSKELIGILTVLENSFFILGCISLIVYIVYTIISLNKQFLINKESLYIKKLNGGSDSSISLEFTFEQVFELPLIMFISFFFSKYIVMRFVLTIQNFWLFNGLTTTSLNIFSKEIILCTLISLFFIISEVLFSTYFKIRKVSF